MNLELTTYTEIDPTETGCSISAGPYPHVYFGGSSQLGLHVSAGRTLHTRHDRLKAISDYLKAVAAEIDGIAHAELLEAIREAKRLHPSTEAGMFSCRKEPDVLPQAGTNEFYFGYEYLDDGTARTAMPLTAAQADADVANGSGVWVGGRPPEGPDPEPF